MSSAINLKRVRVSGWKAIEKPIEIAFDGRSWLIHGENEVGKSSIFSSIRFALFEHPDTSGAFAKEWVHNASGEAEVEVELLIDGVPFTIYKTRARGGSGATQLFDGMGATRTERLKGKDADNEILDLVGAGARSGRKDEIPSDWGILAWLLAPQGVDSVASARDHATQDLGLERAISPEMISVQESLESSLSEELTSGGKKGDRNPKQGGTLKVAIDQVSTRGEQREDLGNREAGYIDLLQELGRKKDAADKNRLKLTEAIEAYDTKYDAKTDVVKLEGEIGKLEAAVEAKRKEAAAAEKAVEDLVTIQTDMATHENKRDETEKKITLAHPEKTEHDREIVGLEERVSAADVSLRKKSKDIGEKKDLILHATRVKRMEELKERLERLDAIEAAIAKLNEEGETLDADALAGFADLAQQIERADAMLRSLAEARGTAVVLEGDLDAKWVVDGREVALDNGMKFASELVIDGAGFTVSLSQEATEDTDWVQERAEGMTRLKELGLSTAEELRERIASQGKSADEMRQLVFEKTGLGDREPIAAELRTMAEGVDSERAVAPDIKVIEAEIPVLEAERDALEKESDEAGQSLVELRVARSELVDVLTALRAEAETSKGLYLDTRTRRDKEIEQAGTLEKRKAASKAVAEELVALEKDLDRQTKRKKTEEEAQRDEVTRALRVKGQVELEQRNLDAEVLSMERECEDLGGKGLRRDLIDLESSLVEARATRDRIERRVRAEERLLHRFSTALTEATELEIGPIKDQVEEWLAQVTEGRWTQVEMDSRLDVTGLKGPARTIPGEKVGSAGLQQLIHALIRLAVAVTIHQTKSAENPEFPPVALVMDESQSHVSENRVIRLAGIFNRQIEERRVQVIALSHRRDEFQALDAMNYDVERRRAYDPDAL